LPQLAILQGHGAQGGQHQPYGQFGHRLGKNPGSAIHPEAKFRGGAVVHVIPAYSNPGYHMQAMSGLLQHPPGNGLGSCQQTHRVVRLHQTQEFLFCELSSQWIGHQLEAISTQALP
jgi:hypothetical protein